MKHNTNLKTNGSFVISLDFELMWGMIDQAEPLAYMNSNVRQVPEVIERMLNLFQEYGIHATFATVGFIFYPNKEELLNDIPQLTPNYINKALNPYYDDFINKIDTEHQPYFFNPNLIEKIKFTPEMEIGTHTFSHYYCWEEGQTIEHFEEDIKKATKIASKHHIELKSIIFPRNNVSSNHLQICKEYGINVYRGNPQKFFSNKKNKLSVMFQKVYRLADNYINLSGSTSYPINEVKEDGMFNIKASRMLRPYFPMLKSLEPLRLRRIKSEMTRAAKNKEIYHLWWHPHNFGANMDKNFAFLEKILCHYVILQERYGMTSLNMSEIADIISQSNGANQS